ncbi:DegT/DnrJ/EryC1/StrS aminotransferase [Solidesulfovibrio fructosivorans JJ]]|uniref:DegT/DnrJ/EryC1/StrS aminotransferase n=1 Tax=Solidesulfovibrio fructosivorans JJ] TaxID=596151 RepID=E1JXR3_SOLFR|nr:LegC family aminotransferase [Solidesulfovibrio fructosivorans]EFL50836.1 DegT/DnrJ/EryC1/StrS aminotransferase [Solidesulfovibrio fructosivorans JJ]]
MSTYVSLCEFIRSHFLGRDRIGLHEPQFYGNERAYVIDAIDSTFVSSVGNYVTRFEEMLCQITGAKYAVATVNGTTALHAALLVAGVQPGDMVLTQPLSFVATANAVAHAGAEPVFLDVEEDTLGLDPGAVAEFLLTACKKADGGCRHVATGRRVAACVPMHTFGHPCRVDALTDVCAGFGVPVVEDAAEALGSLRQGRHCGTFGLLGTLSFNGNKIVTSGGGGAVLTDDPELARRAKHLTTTAKLPLPYRFVHDSVGYNYRMPNLNAALACAQLEQLESFLASKRALAGEYATFCAKVGLRFVSEPADTQSNYWLNAIRLPDIATREAFLETSNDCGIQTRRAWDLLSSLPMFAHNPRGPLEVATKLAAELVNIPSSPRIQDAVHIARRTPENGQRSRPLAGDASSRS